MRLPLALLFVSRLPAELKRRVQSLDYVEKTDILGVPAHHLAGRGKIAFLPQLRAVAVRRKAAPEQSGEQK